MVKPVACKASYWPLDLGGKTYSTGTAMVVDAIVMSVGRSVIGGLSHGQCQLLVDV